MQYAGSRKQEAVGSMQEAAGSKQEAGRRAAVSFESRVSVTDYWFAESALDTRKQYGRIKQSLEHIQGQP